MKAAPDSAPSKGDANDEIAALVANLQQTQMRLQELTGGEIDAVLYPGGKSYFFQEAQEKLWQSETAQRLLAAQQSSILNALPAHIALIDHEGIILSINNAWKSFSEGNGIQSSASFVGQNYLEICDRAHGDYSEEAFHVASGVRAVLSGSTPVFSLEYPCHGPVEPRWFRLMVAPLEKDGAKGAVIMHIDISELKSAEENIRQSEERFRNMFISANTGIAVSTPHGRFLHANAAYCRMLGYTEDELRMRDFASLTHPDDISLNLKLRDQLLSGNRGNFVMEKRYLKKDGETVWTRTSVSATHAVGGEIATLIVIAEDITERRMAEDALRHSEERLRMITNLVPHGIFAKDSAGRHIFANLALAEIAGLTTEEILGKTDFELVTDKAQAEAYRADDRAVIESGNKLVIPEEPRTDLSGRTRFLQTIKIPYTVAETGEHAVLGVCIDITDRKRAEEALLRQKTELQALFDLMPAILCFKDTKNVFLRVNQRLAQAAGRPIAEIEGRPSREFFPLDSDKYYADDLEVIRTGKPKLGIVETIQSADGKKLWVQTDKVPVCDKDEKVTGIVVMVQDITERKQAEENNVRSLALLRATLDSTADGILTIGPDRQILSYNETFKKMSRIPVELLSAKDEEPVFQCILDQLRKADPFRAKVLHLHGHRLDESVDVLDFKDERVFECYSRPMLVEGNPSGRVWSFRDVTERKKLEQQFLRAQRMESIGTLAGGVAHDLNNILTPIMMSVEILKATSDNPRALEILDTLESSAKRGAEIVRQVLSFARGMEGQRIEVQLKHLIKDLENIIKDTFPRNIDLAFSIPNNTWTILGDPTQVHQVLLNLSVNARDAMPNGGKLSIGVENVTIDKHFASMNLQTKPGRYVKINVTDSGTGIPENIVGKIFEPFFTTKELNKGTGLGLSTVMAIVKSHDGIINVYSVPGQGTTFNVYLPAAEISSDGRGEAPVAASLPRGDGETVLVVDDETAILTITRQTLEAFGYRVLTAKDGAEAVAIYAEHRREITVVLTDMMMPLMDGSSVIRVLTRIYPEIKIVASSGLGANNDATQEPGPKFKYFLTKPYTAETLLKTLRMILDEA